MTLRNLRTDGSVIGVYPSGGQTLGAGGRFSEFRGFNPGLRRLIVAALTVGPLQGRLQLDTRRQRRVWDDIRQPELLPERKADGPAQGESLLFKLALIENQPLLLRLKFHLRPNYIDGGRRSS